MSSADRSWRRTQGMLLHIQFWGVKLLLVWCILSCQIQKRPGREGNQPGICPGVQQALTQEEHGAPTEPMQGDVLNLLVVAGQVLLALLGQLVLALPAWILVNNNHYSRCLQSS